MAFFLRPGYFEDHADEWDEEAGEWRDEDDEDWGDPYDDPIDGPPWPSPETVIAWRRRGLGDYGYFIPTCRIYTIPHRCRIYDVRTCPACDKPLHVGSHIDCLPF